MSMDFTVAQRLAAAAGEERKGQLDDAFRGGPDQISRCIRDDSMQFVASMNMPLESYTESDLQAAIQERMRNDPVPCKGRTRCHVGARLQASSVGALGALMLLASAYQEARPSGRNQGERKMQLTGHGNGICAVMDRA